MLRLLSPMLIPLILASGCSTTPESTTQGDTPPETKLADALADVAPTETLKTDTGLDALEDAKTVDATADVAPTETSQTDGAPDVTKDAKFVDAVNDGAVSETLGADDTVDQVGDVTSTGADAGDATAGTGVGIPPKDAGIATLLLYGTVVTPDQAWYGGVLVKGGLIVCAKPGDACASDLGAKNAKVIDTKGILMPGLIDAHNHILFNVFNDDDWLPDQICAYHKEWKKEPPSRYGVMMDTKQCLVNDSQGKPTWCPPSIGSKAGSLRCEANKWGEIKGLIAGTTSIVGLPGTSSPCFGSIARSIDVSQNDLAYDRIQTAATGVPPAPKNPPEDSQTPADAVVANMDMGKTDAFLVHNGEGINQAALEEFAILRSATTIPDGLLRHETVITHGTAFGKNEFEVMAAHSVKLTWSPASNVALYGTTTDIPAALKAGVLVSMGPDWSMGGSQNMLDELRFADAWDDAHWGNLLSHKDLVRMATVNGAQSLALGDQLGSIGPGFVADLTVVEWGDADPAQPWDAILAATPATVRLVLIGGRVVYGEPEYKAASDWPALCETIQICGTSKFLCAAEPPSTDKLNQKFVDIQTALEQALVLMDKVNQKEWKFAPLPPVFSCPGA